MAEPLDGLLNAAAVRARAGQLFELAETGRLRHFRLVPERLNPCAEYVTGVIRADYPALNIPYHSRWRHFVLDGADRWQALVAEHGLAPGDELARTGFDLAVVSVLLDAGAGPDWRYTDAISGRQIARSEGLALASLAMFTAGVFSSDPAQPWQADAAALSALTERTLAAGMQVSAANPLAGLAGRVELLRRLGAALSREFAGPAPRIAALYDVLAGHADGAGALPAAAILRELLLRFGSIWPDGLTVDGRALGDVGRHSQVGGEDASAGLVPFHKLSQWLAYSLIEPLEWAGVRVTGLDDLTGLPEYRNGGLFVDTGVLVPRDAAILDQPLPVAAEPVVEWRALTVCLLDRLADRIRTRLDLTSAELPLARVLQGGTWSAGRRIAVERRAGGAPPIRVDSGGTVF